MDGAPLIRHMAEAHVIVAQHPDASVVNDLLGDVIALLAVHKGKGHFLIGEEEREVEGHKGIGIAAPGTLVQGNELKRAGLTAADHLVSGAAQLGVGVDLDGDLSAGAGFHLVAEVLDALAVAGQSQGVGTGGGVDL